MVTSTIHNHVDDIPDIFFGHGTSVVQLIPCLNLGVNLLVVEMMVITQYIVFMNLLQ